MRQSRAFPAHLKPAVRKLVSLDILADQSSRQRRLFKNDPLVVVRQRQLLRDIASLSPGKDRVEIGWRALQRTVKILRSGRGRRKAIVEALYETWKVRIGRLERRDRLKPQLLHQTVLQGAVHPFPAFRLARVRTQNLDPQFAQRPPELRHTLAALSLRLRDTEDRVLVGIEGEGTSVARQIVLQRLEIREGALRRDEA